MRTYVALLRGINVSGNNPLKMAVLRELSESLGFTDVVTYVQSGNVVFHGTGSTADIAKVIEGRIATDLGLTIAVVVRTAKEIAAVLVQTPPVGAADLDHLHVTFLAERPKAAAVAALDVALLKGARSAPDDFAVLGREVYVHTPNGYGRTKINTTFFERSLGMTATTRSWKTVKKLVELASGAPS